MARQILVPFDDSEAAYRALEYALSEHPDDEITVLQVTDPVDLSREPTITGVTGEGPGQARKDFRLQHVREQAIEQDTSLTAERSTGDLTRVILGYVDEHDVDSVVVGFHDRSKTRRLLSRNVAETLSRRSTVPVTIVS